MHDLISTCRTLQRKDALGGASGSRQVASKVPRELCNVEKLQTTPCLLPSGLKYLKRDLSTAEDPCDVCTEKVERLAKQKLPRKVLFLEEIVSAVFHHLLNQRGHNLSCRDVNERFRVRTGSASVQNFHLCLFKRTMGSSHSLVRLFGSCQINVFIKFSVSS